MAKKKRMGAKSMVMQVKFRPQQEVSKILRDRARKNFSLKPEDFH